MTQTPLKDRVAKLEAALDAFIDRMEKTCIEGSPGNLTIDQTVALAKGRAINLPSFNRTVMECVIEMRDILRETKSLVD